MRPKSHVNILIGNVGPAILNACRPQTELFLSETHNI